MKSFFFAPAAVALVFTTSFGDLRAQSLTMTEPSAAVTVPDGDEFATSVVHSPWNMSQLRDIPLEVGFESISAKNGIWTGVSADPIYYIFPLSPGFLRPNYLAYWSWYTDGMPYGPLNTLDASRYSRISFRMSLAQSERRNLSIFWAKKFNTWPTEEQNLIGWFDGEPSFDAFEQYVKVKQPSGYRIYDIDPNNKTWFDDRDPFLTLPAQTMGKAWSGTIYGFYIWPTDDGSAGARVSFDWIRAYDPTTSPIVPIKWNSAGLDEKYDSIQLYIDTKNSGYKGDLMISGLKNDGTYNLKTAALPPGNYYVYLKAVRHENSKLNVIATSAYSKKITIGIPPKITIKAPSFTSGDDYATTELNNPWDFQDSSDVELTSQMSYITYENGIFSAITDEPIPPYPESDDQIWLNTRRDGEIIPINTLKYRYFTHRIKVNEEPGYDDIFDKVARGWLTRVMWWNEDIEIDGSYSKDIPLLEGWRDYTVDLWDTTFLEVHEDIPGVPQLGWREVGSVRHIRIDPLEAWFPTRFWLDYVFLTAENTLKNGSYNIQWIIEDPDSDQIAVELFADLEVSSNNIQQSATPIATLQQAPGAGSWTWTPTTRTGRYFIRIRASDESRTIEKTSRVPIVVETTISTAGYTPVSGDYNGDGQSDFAVFDENTGNWYVLSADQVTPIAWGFGWGWPGAWPVPGDYNGDGKNDFAVFCQNSGLWFIITLEGALLAWGVDWGWPGAVPVPGDYNGDGRSDFAVFCQNTGLWFVLASNQATILAWGVNWGWPGAQPVSGDYNGDGKNDFAVFCQNTGLWFVLASNQSTILAWGVNWGWPGAWPVPGDYNGDGQSDFAVFCQNTGLWFVLASNQTTILAWGVDWGWPGATPVSGDYNGDGRNDFAIFDVNTGLWFVLSANQASLLAWGVQ